MSLANELQVEKAYVLLFGRPADVGGLNFWEGFLNNGTAYATVVDQMTNSAEFNGLYGGMSTKDMMHQILDNSMKSTPWPTTWSNLDALAASIDSGTLTIGSWMAGIPAANGPDALVNKTYEALHFTNRVEELHLENVCDMTSNDVKGWVSIIGSDFLSVAGAESILDQTIYRASGMY